MANLYPFNYSGKTDERGFYLGRDKFGSNILVDFNKRADDKTNANILILGNSGQGKSYLLKLILTNLRESGMHVLALDPEMEYEELTVNLGGCYIPHVQRIHHQCAGAENWIYPATPGTPVHPGVPADLKLSQHISFLKDFSAATRTLTTGRSTH